MHFSKSYVKKKIPLIFLWFYLLTSTLVNYSSHSCFVFGFSMFHLIAIRKSAHWHLFTEITSFWSVCFDIAFNFEIENWLKKARISFLAQLKIITCGKIIKKLLSFRLDKWHHITVEARFLVIPLYCCKFCKCSTTVLQPCGPTDVHVWRELAMFRKKPSGPNSSSSTCY